MQILLIECNLDSYRLTQQVMSYHQFCNFEMLSALWNSLNDDNTLNVGKVTNISQLSAQNFKTYYKSDAMALKCVLVTAVRSPPDGLLLSAFLSYLFTCCGR